MADFTIKKGDTAPVWQVSLTNSVGTAVDLTGSTVKFVMRAVTAVAPTTNALATLVTPTAGLVSYTFTATDTATAGLFQGSFIVTGGYYPGTYPGSGYLEIAIEEDLVTQTAVGRLVGLGEVREHLNIDKLDRTHDAELLRLIDACTPIVEGLTGPVAQRVYQETYDGGTPFLSLRHRPVVAVNRVVEYRGPIPYELTQVPSPDLGTIYSYMFEPTGRVFRRTVGGGTTSFPGGAETVSVNYTAGYATVPANIRMAVLELVRVNYQQTQQAGHPMFGGGGGDDTVTSTALLGFFVPNRVKELLAPSRRHPSVA